MCQEHSGLSCRRLCEKADSSHHGTWVCYRSYGDYVFVYDNRADGHSAVGKVEGAYYEPWAKYCCNRHGAGTWARCNFDWREREFAGIGGGYRISKEEVKLQHLFTIYG